MAKPSKANTSNGTRRLALTVRLPTRTHKKLRLYCIARSNSTRSFSLNDAIVQLIERAR